MVSSCVFGARVRLIFSRPSFVFTHKFLNFQQFSIFDRVSICFTLGSAHGMTISFFWVDRALSDASPRDSMLVDLQHTREMTFHSNLSPEKSLVFCGSESSRRDSTRHLKKK
jgi:hypothetical protein